jgi:hypothetical protein
MNDQSKPLHRERLLDLKSEVTVSHPSRLELPQDGPAATAPQGKCSEAMEPQSDDAPKPLVSEAPGE